MSLQQGKSPYCKEFIPTAILGGSFLVRTSGQKGRKGRKKGLCDVKSLFSNDASVYPF